VGKISLSRYWPFATSKSAPPVAVSFDAKIAAAIISPWQESKPLYRINDLQGQVNAYSKWVYRCVQVIADAACSVPFRLFTVQTNSNQVKGFRHKVVEKKKLDWMEANNPAVRNAIRKASGVMVEVQDHPYFELMRTVNPFMNNIDIQKTKFISDRLTGNSYWYKVKDKAGRIVELWPLAPQNMAVIPSSKNFIDGYEYRNGGKKIRFEEHEIIHFKDPSPFDPYYGMSPLAAAVTPVTLQAYMDKFNTDLFANMARPEVILSSENTLTDDMVTKIKTRWKEFTGFAQGRSGDVVVMGSGLRIERLTMNPQELSYNESAVMRRNEIFGIFGVPLTKADPSQIAANNEASDIQFLRDTVYPLLVRDQEKLNEKLLSEYDDRLFGAYDDPIPANRQFEMTRNIEYVKAGIKTRNEVRVEEGLEPLPPSEGDVIPPFQGAGIPGVAPNISSAAGVKDIAEGVRKALYGRYIR